jgi:hypothetical protein
MWFLLIQEGRKRVTIDESQTMRAKAHFDSVENMNISKRGSFQTCDILDAISHPSH